MADPKQVIEFAKRVFPDRMAAAEQAHRAASALEAIRSPAEVAVPMLEGFMPMVLPSEAPPSTDLPAAVRAGADALARIDRVSASNLDAQEQAGLEAIVLLVGRPAVLVQDDDFGPVGDMWQPKLDPHRDVIRDAIRRVGRIELTGHPTFPWVGTGFMVAADVVMTNRHVAVTFAQEQNGNYSFLDGVTSHIDFKEEYQRSQTREVSVKEVIGIHDRYDLALLRIESAGGVTPLTVSASPPSATKDYDVVVIGYPAYDSRNDAKEMIRIFDNIFNVKRLQPGMLTGVVADATPKQIVGHDCSTLGGNSGSLVFDYLRQHVVGLHFGGRYLQGNSAVPLWLLANDPLLKKAGVNFG